MFSITKNNLIDWTHKFVYKCKILAILHNINNNFNNTCIKSFISYFISSCSGGESMRKNENK